MARHSGLQLSIALVDAVKIEGFHSLPIQEPLSVKVRFEPSLQDVKRSMKGSPRVNMAVAIMLFLVRLRSVILVFPFFCEECVCHVGVWQREISSVLLTWDTKCFSQHCYREFWSLSSVLHM